MRYGHWASIAAGILLGLIFFVAGLGKLPVQTEAYMIIFNLPRALLEPTLANHIDTWLPRLEIALGLLLIAGIALKAVAAFSLAFTGAFIFNNAWVISQGLAQQPCGCFGALTGTFLSSMSTQQALYMDIGMLALVAIILFWYPGKWRTVRPWFLRKW